ncbi:hypothetical protein HCU64_22475 [Methylobacterium sp. C25]|uniref:DUF6894 family protein n=1 Tax=Methylobacterium sp. C25 TaxID=2721622 RepID=UPI001F38BC55|nr:hypothetical protein [Methylobacterium sp. C25]MCE4226513.1 hypothetical protein [Methylobacterium sp. C25]
MPRFYFDTDDGDFHYRDEEGVVLSDAMAARSVAINTLPEFVRNRDFAKDRYAFSVHVRDELGNSIYLTKLALTGGWQAAIVHRT